MSWKKIIMNLAEKASGRKVQDVSTENGLTRFMESFTDGISNLWKGITGSGLTARDIQLNEMNMQNVRDTAQAQTEGYQKAGVNPALMFGGGAQTAPQSSGVPTTGSMSELMQFFMLPMQMKMLGAQIGNINADTDKKIAETGRIGYEIEEMREKIRGLGLSNEQERIILSYLDRMQRAELSIKESSKERLDMDIKSIEQNIHNMSAEECATYISMLETIEKMNTLVSEQKLNEEFGKYYAKLCSNLEAQNKILKLQERDWDYINVVGSTSFSTGVGPFKGSESRPVTLHDLKNTAEKVGREKAEQKKNSNKSWEEIKKDASDKYGALE